MLQYNLLRNKAGGRDVQSSKYFEHSRYSKDIIRSGIVISSTAPIYRKSDGP